MKATKIISACAVLVALASCSNDHVISQPGAEDTPIRIQANVGAVTTKAGAGLYDQNNNFENGAKINVYIFENGGTTYTYGSSGLLEYTADGNGNLDVKDTGGSSVPQYFPANGHGIDVYGIYPTSVKEKNSTQDFSVNTDQSEDADYKASDLMYAGCQSNKKKEDNIQLAFQHKLAKVIVILKQGDGLKDGDLNNAEVKITNTYVKCSIAKVDKTKFGPITASTEAVDKKAITVGNWSTASNNESNGIAAIVVPQTVSKGTQLFEVKLSNNAVYKYTRPSDASDDVVFTQENVHTYTLTLTTSGISVTSSIKDWTTGTGGSGEATLN